MMKKLIIALGLVLVVLIFAVAVSQPTEKVKVGDTVQPMTLTSIVGAEIKVPNPSTRLTHLQFRRFAGCPICNLHMHQIIDRYDDIKAVGIKEVVVFHSPNSDLVDYQGKFPFDVIGDPDKKLYAQFGVDESVMSLLDPRAWPTLVRALAMKDKPIDKNEHGGHITRPAEFLIDSFGRVIASHYGSHAADQWSVDELIDHAKR